MGAPQKLFAGRYEMTTAARCILTPTVGRPPGSNAVRKAEAWDRAKLLAL